MAEDPMRWKMTEAKCASGQDPTHVDHYAQTLHILATKKMLLPLHKALMQSKLNWKTFIQAIKSFNIPDNSSNIP